MYCFKKCDLENVQSLSKLEVLVSSVSGIFHNKDFDLIFFNTTAYRAYTIFNKIIYYPLAVKK